METRSGSEADLLDTLGATTRDERYRHAHGAPGHGADHVRPRQPVGDAAGARGEGGARHLAVAGPGRPQHRQPAASGTAELPGGLTLRLAMALAGGDGGPRPYHGSSRGDWCCQIAFTPRELPAKEVAFAASTRCEGEKRDA